METEVAEGAVEGLRPRGRGGPRGVRPQVRRSCSKLAGDQGGNEPSQRGHERPIAHLASATSPRLFRATLLGAFVLVLLYSIGDIAPSPSARRRTRSRISNGSRHVHRVLLGVHGRAHRGRRRLPREVVRINGAALGQSVIVVLRRRASTASASSACPTTTVSYRATWPSGGRRPRQDPRLRRGVCPVRPPAARALLRRTWADHYPPPRRDCLWCDGLALYHLIISCIQPPFAHRALSWSRDRLGVVTRKFQRLRRVPRDPSPRRHRHPDPEVRRGELGTRRARWWAITLQNSHTSIVQFLGTMTTAVRALPGRQPRAEPELEHRHRYLRRAPRHHRHAAAAGHRAGVQRVPRRACGGGRLCEPFEEPILPVESATARECPPLDGPVTFEGVQFTYPQTARTVLHDVTFTMEPTRSPRSSGTPAPGSRVSRSSEPHLRPRHRRGEGQRHRAPRAARRHHDVRRSGIVPADRSCSSAPSRRCLVLGA